MNGKITNFFIGGIAVVAALAVALIIAKTSVLGLVLVPLLALTLILIVLVVRRPELGWLLIVFFLPFERVPSVEMGGINLKINTLLGALTLIAWGLALLFNGKKYKVQPNPVIIPLLLFAFTLVLSLLQAFNFTRALSVLIFTLFTMALSILAVNLVHSKETLKKTLLVLFGTALLAGLFGLFQFGGDVVGLPQSLTLLKEGYTKAVFGFPRVQAFSMEPLYFANFLLIPICVGLTLFLNRQEPIKRWWMIGLIGLLLVNFILTVSRGGYLGLAISFLVIGVLLFRRLFNWRTILIGVVTAVVVVYGVAFALSHGDNRATLEFLGHIQLQDQNRGESIDGRLAAYKRGLVAWRENPIWGIGLGNFGPWATDYPDARPVTGWPIVNNQYIELLAETGIVGVTAFGLVLLMLILRTFIALKYAHDLFFRSVLIGLFAAFIGILVQYNFMSTLYIIHIWIAIGLLIAVQNIILRSKMINSKL